jgi:hypothetical protein
VQRGADTLSSLTKHITDCAECQRLWHEYSAATAEHIKLDNKLSLAALSRDTDAVSRLTPEVETAVVTRSMARRAIEIHEMDAHAADAATA